MAQLGLQPAVFRAFSSYLAAPAGLMVLAAALVSAQPLFDPDRGLVGAVICIRGHSFGFEQCAGIEMQNAFSAKSEAVFTNRCMARITASKIFRGSFFDPIGDFPL
jgi:hypothetical protein